MASGKNEWLVTLTHQVKKAEGAGPWTWNEVDANAKARYITTNLDGQVYIITHSEEDYIGPKIQKLNSDGTTFEDVIGAPVWPLMIKTVENDKTWVINS